MTLTRFLAAAVLAFLIGAALAALSGASVADSTVRLVDALQEVSLDG